jgi:predicted acylesterase/phospholipase RssA
MRMTLLITALILLAGCSYPNEALNDTRVPLEARVRNQTRSATFTAVAPPQGTSPELHDPAGREITPTRSASVAMAASLQDRDGYFVGLALSGGGSRSANFSAACMFQLERLGLLDRVDYISSVSGGSLTAAYYCLNTGDWNPQNMQRRLTHSFATDMLIQTLLPWNTFALLFTDYDRSDLLAKTLNENLFHGQTYTDLRTDRPRLLINTTDLQTGRRFVFCNETFDRINSDLSKLPVAYAVAASSSVPVVLHDVTLRDFSTDFKQYRHLVDGGVADNLGVETLVETYRAQVEAAAAHGLPDPYPHGAVFIVIDARTEYDQNLSSKSDTGIVEAISSATGLSTRLLLNRASSATLDDVVLKNAPDKATVKEVRDAIAALQSDGYVDFANIAGHHIRVAHIALTQLESLSQLPFNSFQESVNSTGTYFNITQEKAAELYVAADLLFRDRYDEHFKALLKEMRDTDSQATTVPTTAP